MSSGKWILEQGVILGEWVVRDEERKHQVGWFAHKADAEEAVLAHNAKLVQDLSVLTFAGYSREARTTAFYPNRGANLMYPALGLAGEAGEVANLVKKVQRDREGRMDEAFRAALRKELGDCVWYLDAMCFEVGTSFEDCAIENLAKLRSRKERGTLGGSGDQR